MRVSVNIEILGAVGEAAIGEAIRAVTLGYAQLTQARLTEDKPPPPGRGSMQWKSEKQRRFVMAAWRRGDIQIPYKRGTGGGLKGSETLNRSYTVNLLNDEAVLTSAASYAPYVVGDQQAQIHVGRWNTAQNAVEQVRQSGDLDELIGQVMEAL